MHAMIGAIEYHLPSSKLTTADLATRFPEWAIEKTDAKTGIRQRSIVSGDDCASDLAVAAAEALFRSGRCAREEIDFILLCTQSPDYVLPTTACLLQERLRISKAAGALDFNLGCSGFVYGLGLASGLIRTNQASSIILLTAETYSKYLAFNDKGTRAIFGDGAAATWITGGKKIRPSIGPFVYGTDGRGSDNLIVPNSASRRSGVRKPTTNMQVTDCSASQSLFMDGNKLFAFAVETVPKAVIALLRKSSLSMRDIELFVFHQANAYLIEEIRKGLGVPEDRVQITIGHCANTVSSTIPIALKHAELEGKLKSGDRVMLVGFGVGYSWGATIVRWSSIQ